jgi:hypothetical protein
MPMMNDVELTTLHDAKPCCCGVPWIVHRQFAHDGSVWLPNGYLMFIV